ncbi:MAG TPA: UDP-N-acetylmuramoyl-L-alanyl-D-glutamate--2,6-diaminopimelate ligase, partial [Chitinophagaceae bacterium]|nr:UDP-N-acetylmuramoyl-L-alanyl-D-glutamate--2,6-diaminopimelate ligase [Chitinophagaceae bacterium]
SIVDRKEAIKTAISLAKPEDIILIAGKGHEYYQEIKGVRNHFDDKEEVKEFFELLNR